MDMMKKSLKIFTFLVCFLLSSKIGAATFPAGNGIRNINNFPKIARKLIDGGMYFTAVPFIKEYLTSRKKINNKEVDQIIDELVTHVGVKQFEILPKKILQRSKAPVISYILSKKLFRFGKYDQALKAISGKVPDNHAVKPFALMLEASIYSVTKDYKRAVEAYDKCVDLTSTRISRTSNKNKKRQLEVNRDSCIVGISRSQFADKKNKDAHLSYLDLSKKSHIWPEILFEEAWNSFYLKDYNRTLGKLVSYKAPFFNHIFNPEIDVLRTLTYYEMCLWSDALKEVDQFYKKYQTQSRAIRKLLKRNGANYKFYYESGKNIIAGKTTRNPLFNKILKSITRDSTFQELFNSFLGGKDEVDKLKSLSPGQTKTVLASTLKSSLGLQRNLLGAYVRKNLYIHLNQLEKAFEGMSYIKLQVIALRKKELYEDVSLVDRTRGDIQQLKRNDKQYFWDFVGEFWADELGDYVFALKSECKK